MAGKGARRGRRALGQRARRQNGEALYEGLQAALTHISHAATSRQTRMRRSSRTPSTSAAPGGAGAWSMSRRQPRQRVVRTTRGQATEGKLPSSRHGGAASSDAWPWSELPGGGARPTSTVGSALPKGGQTTGPSAGEGSGYEGSALSEEIPTAPAGCRDPPDRGGSKAQGLARSEGDCAPPTATTRSARPCPPASGSHRLRRAVGGAGGTLPTATSPLASPHSLSSRAHG